MNERTLPRAIIELAFVYNMRCSLSRSVLASVTLEGTGDANPGSKGP